MPVFHYKSMSPDGALAEGFMDASDESIVIDRLKKSGAIPLMVAARKEGLKERLISFSKKGDIQTFTAELSVLLSARLPLDKSLSILSGISESTKMREVVESVLASIREGSSFSEALSMHPKWFPKFYVNMIRAGEASGVLDEVLERLNEFLESSRELKEHVFSAMIYPAILLVTGFVSIIILIAFVLPRFAGVLGELGGRAPLPARILLTASEALQSVWWIILILMIAVGLAVKNYIASEKGRYEWDRLKLRMMDEVIRKLETARFCRTLGTLLRSGVPLLQALNNSKDVIHNRVIASALDGIAGGAKEGRGIAIPLAEAGVFPSLAVSMIKVGEETGQLDTMLVRIAVAYERNLRESIKRLLGFLEPVMILIMGVLIGFIVISMLTAIFSITDLPL